MQDCQLTYYRNYFLDRNRKYVEETLWLDFPYELLDEEIMILKQYGITETPITFTEDFLSTKTMILQEEKTSIQLKKF